MSVNTPGCCSDYRSVTEWRTAEWDDDKWGEGALSTVNMNDYSLTVEMPQLFDPPFWPSLEEITSWLSFHFFRVVSFTDQRVAAVYANLVHPKDLVFSVVRLFARARRLLNRSPVAATTAAPSPAILPGSDCVTGEVQAVESRLKLYHARLRARAFEFCENSVTIDQNAGSRRSSARWQQVVVLIIGCSMFALILCAFALVSLVSVFLPLPALDWYVTGHMYAAVLRYTAMRSFLEFSILDQVDSYRSNISSWCFKGVEQTRRQLAQRMRAFDGLMSAEQTENQSEYN